MKTVPESQTYNSLVNDTRVDKIRISRSSSDLKSNKVAVKSYPISIFVHFRSQKDVEAFASLMKMDLHSKTKHYNFLNKRGQKKSKYIFVDARIKTADKKPSFKAVMTTSINGIGEKCPSLLSPHSHLLLLSSSSFLMSVC